MATARRSRGHTSTRSRGGFGRAVLAPFTPGQLNPLAWYDVHLATPGQTVADQMGGTAATLGSTAGADANDPVWLARTDSDFLYLPGVAGNYVSTPDTATLDITGDFEIVVRIEAASYGSGVSQVMVAKEQSATTRTFRTTIGSTGTFFLTVSANGSTALNAASSVALTTVLTNGVAYWLKVTWRQSDGRTQFFYAADQTTEPASWTQLGTDQIVNAATPLFVSTSEVSLGARNAGATEPLAGKLYRSIIRSGIGGTVVADFDPSKFSAGSATTYTDSVGTNGGVWTINRSTAGRKASLVKGRGLLLHGTDDLFTVPTASTPSFGTATPGTVVVVGRVWPTPLSNGRWVDTRGSATETVAGVGIRQNGTAASLVGTIGDGTNTAATAAVGYTAGQVVVASLVVDATTIKLRVNGSESATVARPAGSATGTTPIVGAATTGAASPFEGGVFAAFTANRALTSSELGTIEAYYGAGT